ncbi:MAG: G5 domain-containing protein [Clostridium fessum]
MRQSATADRTSSSSTTRNIRWLSRQGFSASDRKLTIALYGVPILKEGVKIRMSSEKTGEIDPPSAVYTEDGSLQPNQEVQTKAATPGSRWSTDLVAYENDKEVSREFFTIAAIVERRRRSNVTVPLL